MIPKYPDSVERFLIDRHFSKQWSNHNYDHAPHCTCIKEQALSFQMACFQGYMDHVVLLPCTQVDTHKNNTHLNSHAHKQASAHTCKHAHTAQTHTHQNRI